jgi:hypothetical protein
MTCHVKADSEREVNTREIERSNDKADREK